MNILFISQLYPTRPVGDGEIITYALHNFVKHWNKTDPVVVVRPVYLYLSQPKHLLKHFRKKIVTIDNVTVIVFPVFKIPKVSYLYAPLYRFLDKYLSKTGFAPGMVVAHYDKSLQIGYRYARRSRLPLIAGLHITPDLLAHEPGFFTRRCGHVLEYASGIACRSSYIDRKINRWFPGYKEKQFIALSGIEDDIIQPLPHAKEKLCQWKTDEHQPGAPPGNVSIITVCRLIEIKKIHTVLEALAALDSRVDWTYTLIGDGEERPRLEALASELQIKDRVRFLGKMPRQDAVLELKKSHIFVMVSVLETFGLVYLEAMATGNIVICGEGEGIDGIIEHGKNGFLSPPAQSQPLTRLLDDIIINQSHQTLSTLLDQAHNTIGRFTHHTTAQYYLDQIKDRQ